MLVSILILTHNRLGDVKRCIESLDDTAGRNDVEMIVLDNASTDGTAEYLEQMLPLLRGNNTQFIKKSNNLGVAGGRSELLKKAQGDVLIFLDSDVKVLEDEWLDRLLVALESENVGLVGPAGSMVMGDFTGFYPGQAGMECDVVSGWCQAFKREVIDAGVWIDTEFKMFWTEDSDFCLQIRAAGWDVVCTGGIGVLHEPGLSGDEFADRAANQERFRAKWQGQGLIKAEGGW